MSPSSKPLAIAAVLLCALEVRGEVAADVVALRGEVADLRAQLSEARAVSRTSLLALVGEREELARQVRLERIKAATLDALARERAVSAAGLETRQRALLDEASAAVKAVRDVIASSPPVHRAQRLATLDRIDATLNTPRPDVASALERLWRFLEEEEALGREIAVDKQAFELGDKTRLLEVAHIGLAVMYARTPEGAYGFVKHTGEIHWFDDVEIKAVLEDVFFKIARGERELQLVIPK